MSTILPFSEALCFRKFLNRWWAKLSKLRTVFDLILRWLLVTIPDVLKSGSSTTSKLSTKYRAVFETAQALVLADGDGEADTRPAAEGDD